jgi:hypothetical protein
MKKLLVRFDSETTLVNGYFVKGAKYFNNVIDEESKTIDGFPYIEIEESQQINDKEMCVVDGVYQEYVKPTSILLAEAISTKKTEIKALRAKSLAADLLAKNIDGKAYYVKTDPEINLFSSAMLMPDDSTRLWGCFCDDKKELIELSKSDLLNIAHNYEERKNQEYNLCDKRRVEIDALATIEEVEAFDITKIYE